MNRLNLLKLLMNRPKPHKLCNADRIKKYANCYVLLKWQIICDKKCVMQEFGGNKYSKNNKWEHYFNISQDFGENTYSKNDKITHII